MKRRTRPSLPRPRVLTAPVIDPVWSNEKIHGIVWDYLEACSDSDGWLFFQLTLFPAMATPEDVAGVEEWESVYLENRGLTIAQLGPDVVLVKDGSPIAGCSLDYYEAARDFLTDVSDWQMIS